jgi:hypothetical protein
MKKKGISMVTDRDVYNHGKIELEETIATNKQVPVVVTILKEIENTRKEKFDLMCFSFEKARSLMAYFQRSLSEAVIE